MVESPAPAPPPAGGSTAPYWVAVGFAFALGVLLLVVGGRSASQGGLNLGAPGSAGSLSEAEAREEAPDFRLSRVGAEGAVTREELAGSVVVLHFWATWCAPCRAEFPEFARYAAKAEGMAGIRVLAVSLDESPDEAMIWALRNGGGITVWHDQKQLASEMGVTGIPTTVLLDAQGRIAYFQAGAQDWSEGGVPARVEALLGE